MQFSIYPLVTFKYSDFLIVINAVFRSFQEIGNSVYTLPVTNLSQLIFSALEMYRW